VKKLSPAEVLELRRARPVYILDVRPLWWEQSDAALEGAVFIPLVNLDLEYQAVPRDREIIVTDGAMLQSPSAAKFLVAKGFKVLGVLKGGVLRWEKEGFPVLRQARPE
jgi:rhodanese-related sulfurtransferase